MNIYELEKKATQVPLKAFIDGTIEDDTGLEIAECITLGKRGGGNERDEANAALLVHCRNKFMIAIETLKAQRGILADSQLPRTYHQSKIQLLDDLDALIDELEEVKV